MNQGSALLLATLSLVACRRPALTPAPEPTPTYWIASDASFYSPVARLRLTTAADAGHVRVIVDSGLVTVPGRYSDDAPVMMRDLYVTAFIATRNSSNLAWATADTGELSDRRGWRALATSDSALLVTQIRFGETKVVKPFQLTVPLAEPRATSLWLVFRITGIPTDLRVPFEGPLRSGKNVGRVRVYACGDRTLSGQLDTARSNGLRRAYGLVC